MVGEPLAAPFARPPVGAWTNLPANSVLSGITNLTLQCAAGAPNRPVQQVDLFLDGTWLQTLTNIPPAAGNQLYVDHQRLHHQLHGPNQCHDRIGRVRTGRRSEPTRLRRTIQGASHCLRRPHRIAIHRHQHARGANPGERQQCHRFGLRADHFCRCQRNQFSRHGCLWFYGADGLGSQRPTPRAWAITCNWWLPKPMARR